MRVVLVGAGAVGSLLGWALASTGADVSVVRRRGSTAVAELVVVDPVGVQHSAAVRSMSDRTTRSGSDPTTRSGSDPATLAEPPDLILLAVKAFDLPAALAAVAAWPSTAVLTVQNGIGAEEATLEARPQGPLLAGSLTASVERSADGSVRWLRRGGIGLAAVQGDVAELRDELVGHVRRAGLLTRALPEWRAMKWSKLLANLVANATSGILDRDPAAIYADPVLYGVERVQLQEALAVMAAQGLRPVGLPGAPIVWLARAVGLPPAIGRPILARAAGGARGGKSPSLRLHLASGAGGPGEIEQLNGAVVAAGAQFGLPTPVNAALVAAYADVAADPSRRAWYRAHPEALTSGR
ncbi:MAG TPA: 2-dehydropantoate 2-reductase [Candidatus Limnocylindrales bacterium]|nr:2-dehydropantoate 2-reductase [Candidatus Limnocylindrales bacterium]